MGDWLFSFGARLLERIRDGTFRHRQHCLQRSEESRFRFRAFDVFGRLHLIAFYAMPTIHFLGRIVPSSGVEISFTVPTVNYRSPDNDLTASFLITFSNSEVDVRCDVNRFVPNDSILLALIHKPAFDAAKAALSMVSFSTGIGFTLVFEQFVNINGAVSIFRQEDSGLAALCTAFDASSISEVLTIVLSDFSLCIAMNDLIEAITLTHHAPASCARCIERLRTVMTPGTDRDRAWAQFRSNLQLSREYLNLITHHATGPRHGDPTFISPAITREIIQRSWIIVNRFLVYRMRGSIQLPLSEFHLL
jgi:hypothetical protein